MNNMPYVLAVEKLAGIEVPDRVKTIRVMMAEFFRIASHLLFLGTYIQDLGAMTPIFFMFADRQKAYDVIEAVTGFRMHPAWFRIGGVAHDLPHGWDTKVREFLDWFPKRLDEYVKAALENSVLRGRAIGIAQYNTLEALEWGVTGGGLRATGCDFDYRKARPYSGTRISTSKCPWARTGMPTIAAWCASRNCARAAHHPPVPGAHAGRSLQSGPSADLSARRASACSSTSRPSSRTSSACPGAR